MGAKKIGWCWGVGLTILYGYSAWNLLKVFGRVLGFETAIQSRLKGVGDRGVEQHTRIAIDHFCQEQILRLV